MYPNHIGYWSSIICSFSCCTQVGGNRRGSPCLCWFINYKNNKSNEAIDFPPFYGFDVKETEQTEVWAE